MGNSTCFRIKIVMRYKLGKQIVRPSKISSNVQESRSVNLFVPPPAAVLPFPTSLIKNNTSSFGTSEKLRNFLQDDSIGKIGVWGMGGVCKTRLLKNLNNELQGTELFDGVIFVTVSKNWNRNMQKLRNDIGKELYMELEKVDEVKASRLLYMTLLQKKFLLILDDVWDEIDLENLGIPSPIEHNGCKIAITTRQRWICNEMETDVEIMVEVLSDEQECSGLPLAIITVESALRNEVRLDQWNRALRLLQESKFGIGNMEDRVFVPPEIKRSPRPDRVLDNGRVYRWNTKKDMVKMHDVIRDIAIKITSDSNASLYEIPEGFFQHMKLLSVLDLSATSIEFLPESISVLVNLSALILKECPHLSSIDHVQLLKKLRFLDMRESGIIELSEVPSKALLYSYAGAYAYLVFLLIVAELAAAAFIFFDHSWKDLIPDDKTGNFDIIYDFLDDNWKIAKWVALGTVILEVSLFYWNS
ncbi:hypothetical protein ZIOFF_045463 [Zingiber officinale]|uniref:NB-ARC domain-containing protein n=1 Tax=Zingiber officinale TaxID=94328 RepID=A0A8J5KYB0_ZINOF|nr:hypothetical protein ZIOFF_045463 [Zingiber officinale]